jgi:ligand-binding sensor domain-containing protein/two-component sensor histidine kinase
MKLSYARVLILLYFCASSTVYALDPAKSLAQYGFEVWQARDGLPHGTVRSIAQTDDGYLWIGTEIGLVRFDGVRFQLFNSKNEGEMTYWGVGSLYTAKGGVLWFGDADNLLKRDPETGITVSGFEFPKEKNTVTGVVIDGQGSLWVSHSGSGLYKVTKGKVSSFTENEGLISNNVLALSRDSEGRVWAGTSGGVTIIENGRVKSFNSIGSEKNPRVGRIFNSRDGTIWLNVNGRLHSYREGTFELWEPQSDLSDVTALCQDKDNNLWIGTSEGLYRYSEGKLSSTNVDDLLPDRRVSALFEDMEGNLWVGTRRGGLVVIRDPRLNSISIPEGLPNDYVNAINEDPDGTLWIGTRGGLSKLSNGNLITYTKKDGLLGDNVKSLWRDRRGRLWIGSSLQGVQYMEGGSFFSLGQNVTGLNNVITICESSDGRIWFGSEDGGKLFYFNNGRFIDVENIRGSDILRPRVLLPDNMGNIWIGSTDGLKKISNGKRTQIEEISDSPLSIRSLYMDKRGDLWVGTSSSGLYRLIKGRLQTYNEERGLYDNGITQIVEDLKGNLWFGSRAGIFRVNKSEFDRLDKGLITRLHSTAYDSRIRDWKCMLDARYTGREGPQNILYFPTDRGMMIVDTNRLTPNSFPPMVHIEQVLAKKENISISSRAAIPPNLRDIEIDYTGLNFTAPDKVRFKYMLEGFDRDWIDAGTRRTAYYTNLPRGNYRFRVLASNGDGLWNQKGDSFEFYLRPHFYETPLFYTLCGLFVAGIIWALYLLRLRRVQTQFDAVLAERNRIARDIHDTLLQGVAGVAFQLKAISRKWPESAPETEALNRAIDQVNRCMTDSRRSLWELRSSALSGEGLSSALRRMANQLISNTSTNITLNVNGDHPRLSNSIETNLLRITHEAIVNALRHARPQNISVELNFDSQCALLSVKDDGPGFDSNLPTNGTNHYGIIGMRERAEMLGGQLTISSIKGEGTEVFVVVPIN